MPEDNWTIEELLALAEIIGKRIEAGNLPPKNQYGQYLI